MESQNNIAVRGIVTRRLFDASGKPKKMFKENAIWELIKETFNLDLKIPLITGYWTTKPIVHNTITAAGLAKVAGMIIGVATDPFLYLGIGTGTSTASGLTTEITTGGGERALGTESQVTTTEADDTAQVIHEWTFSDTFAITEEALYNAAVAGDVLAYRNFSAVNVESGNKFEVTHQIVVAIPA